MPKEGCLPSRLGDTKALCDFTRNENFDLCIAFHSQGKVIYYDFNNKEPAYSLIIAKEFEKISDYKIQSGELLLPHLCVILTLHEEYS